MSAFFPLQAAHRLIASWLRVCNRRNDRKQLLRYCASARPSPSSFSSFSIRFSFHRKENSKRVSGNGSRAVGKGDGFRDVSKLSTFRIINSRSFSTRSSKVNWFPARVPAIGKSLFRCCFRVRKQSFFSIDPLDRAVEGTLARFLRKESKRNFANYLLSYPYVSYRRRPLWR